jgi:hypothetical protein
MDASPDPNRERKREALAEVSRADFSSLGIHRDGDIGDICRLTCLEQGISVVGISGVTALEVYGLKVILNMDNQWSKDNEKIPALAAYDRVLGLF